MVRWIALRAVRNSVGDVPLVVSGLITIRIGVPSGAATESSTMADTTRPAKRECSAKYAAPCPPVVPPSVDRNSSPCSGLVDRSSLASSSITPTEEALSSAPVPTPSWCATTAIRSGSRPGR